MDWGWAVVPKGSDPVSQDTRIHASKRSSRATSDERIGAGVWLGQAELLGVVSLALGSAAPGPAPGSVHSPPCPCNLSAHIVSPSNFSRKGGSPLPMFPIKVPELVLVGLSRDELC